MPVAVEAETLPTLDLRRFDGQASERLRFLEDLRTAARNVGFFYLVGHGIKDGLIQDVLKVSRRFFALPEKDKRAIEMVNSPHFRGYNRAGFEHTRGKPDWREQVDIGPERPALSFEREAPPWTRLQGPNQWPAAFPEFKPTLLAYQDEITALAIRVLRAFAAALEQPEDIFAPIYTPAPNPLIKIIRYPGRASGESDQGVGAHKDSGFVTLLLQEKQAGLRFRPTTAVGSTRRLSREASSSTSARFSKWPPTAICAPTSIAWLHRHKAPTACPSRFSSERAMTRRFRCFRCRPDLPRRRVE
jgi:isopenicillin N synthase-like dioxygenase